jgi:prepilin peptidase CpaA
MKMDFYLILMILVVAVAWDLRSFRIPNVLTAPAALAGLSYQVATAGFPGLKSSLLGMMVGLGILLIPFLLGGLGGGDVKLLAAMGAWLGPQGILFAALYSGLAGGLLALGVMVATGEGAFKFMKTIYDDVVYFVSFGERPPLAERGKRRIPYSLAIAAGTVAFLVVGAPV